MKWWCSCWMFAVVIQVSRRVTTVAAATQPLFVNHSQQQQQTSSLHQHSDDHTRWDIWQVLAAGYPQSGNPTLVQECLIYVKAKYNMSFLVNCNTAVGSLLLTCEWQQLTVCLFVFFASADLSWWMHLFYTLTLILQWSYPPLSSTCTMVTTDM